MVQFKHDTGEGDLAKYLNGKPKMQSEWAGWQAYQKKNTGRLSEIKRSPRLEPVRDGDQVAPINPSLLLRAIRGSKENCSEVNCALEPNKESVSFADQFSTAHTLYNKTILAKASVEAVANFHRLLYMEIQFLMGCDVTWKNATALGGSDEPMS